MEKQRMKMALVGISGSGKSTVSEYVSQKYGAKVCSTGGVCRAISNILFGTEERKYLNLLTDKLKSIDENILMEAALKKDDMVCVFDSIRYESDYRYLKNKGFSIVKIECSEQLAMKRLKERGQLYKEEDLEHGSECGINLIPYDYSIDNNNSLKELYSQVDRLFS